jgi:hypothetical protein
MESKKFKVGMVNKHYAINQEARKNEIIKKAPNPLMIGV